MTENNGYKYFIVEVSSGLNEKDILKALKRYYGFTNEIRVTEQYPSLGNQNTVLKC